MKGYFNMYELEFKKINLFNNFNKKNKRLYAILFLKQLIRPILQEIGLREKYVKDVNMNERLKESWSAITNKSAKNYLKGFGNGSSKSKIILSDILKKYSYSGKKLSVVEFGCGNGQLFETFLEEGVKCHYAGVDFSEPLLEVAKEEFKDYDVEFILDDAEKLTNVIKKYDVGIYSHVIEMLSSPEESLMNARKHVDTIIIRFFEPPKFDNDRVELKEMDVIENTTIKQPYLRRKMSKDYYRLILSKIGCIKVDVYVDDTSNDEVHVLHFKGTK